MPNTVPQIVRTITEYVERDPHKGPMQIRKSDLAEIVEYIGRLQTIQSLDDVNAAAFKQGFEEAKAIYRRNGVPEARPTQQASGDKCADCSDPFPYGLQAVAVESGFVCRKCWGARNG